MTCCNSYTSSKTEIRFFLGYSGWTKLQLENELKENSWLLIENKEKEKKTTKTDSPVSGHLSGWLLHQKGPSNCLPSGLAGCPLLPLHCAPSEGENGSKT